MNLDQFDEKTRARFAELAREVQTARETGANHGTVLSDAIRAMKRANARATPLPADMERIEILPQRGPKLEFTGRLIAHDQWETRGRDPMRVEFEIYETKGGALVAVSASEPLDRDGAEVVKATVVERILRSTPEYQRTEMDGAIHLGANPTWNIDEQVMHFAVMAAFDWHDRARSMARKLGWDLRVEID